MSLTFVGLIIVTIAFVFLYRRSHVIEHKEEVIMTERFKVRFGYTPRSSNARKAVDKKLTQLSRLAKRGTTEDQKEYEIALNIAKRFGFAK